MVIRTSKAVDEGFLIQSVGFTEIIERAGVVAQLGIDEPHEEVRIHRCEGFQIHTRSVNKAESG